MPEFQQKEKFHIDFSYTQAPKPFGSINLVQLGRYFSNKNSVIESHAHTNYFELTVVLDGEGTIYSNTVPTEVKRNDVYLSLPNDIHKIVSSASAPLKFDFFSFSTSDDELASALKTIEMTCLAPTNRVFRDKNVSTLVDMGISELLAESDYQTETLTSILRLLVVHIIKNFNHPTSRVHTAQMNPNKADELCYQLMSYINSHIYEIKNLEELAQNTNYCYPHLSTLFKKHTSQTLSEYFRFQKLEKAKTLIEETELSLTEIAEKLNYASIYSFSKAFKNQYRICPAEYRKSLKN
jgi:AraC-like DNA-binding protein